MVSNFVEHSNNVKTNEVVYNKKSTYSRTAIRCRSVRISDFLIFYFNIFTGA